MYKDICITNIMIEMTLELAEICGIHAGDGYMRIRGNKGEVDISGHLEEKDYYDNCVVPLFKKAFGLDLRPKSFPRGSYGIVIYNKKIAESLNNLGFPSVEKSLTVKVLDITLKSKDKFLYASFLRGLFDTDGNLYFMNRKTERHYKDDKKKHNYYPLIRLRTSSKTLCEQMSLMIDELNIKYFVSSYKPKKLNENEMFTITVSGSERLNKWMELIGMKNSVKLTRYLIWKKFGFCPPNTNLQQREDILNGKLDIYNMKGSSFNG